MDKGIIQIQTTYNSEDEVRRIAMKLLESNLAACVQFFPISSIYRWKKNIEETEEYLLLIKTTVKNKEKILNFLEKEHTYEVPEIMISEMDTISDDYAKWIADETK